MQPRTSQSTWTPPAPRSAAVTLSSVLGTAVQRRAEPTVRVIPSRGLVGHSAPKLQKKLTVNTPGDQYEQEADRVAEQVMRMPEPQVQRQCACGKSSTEGECSECKKKKQDATGSLQRVASSPVGGIAAPPIVNSVLSSPGSPLPTATRSFMESRFSQDFSHVRVHTDAAATQSAADVQARAYAVGNHVVFGQGESPTRDQRLLAHELTHVLQQSRVAESRASAPNEGAAVIDQVTELADIGLQRTPLASDEQTATSIFEVFLKEQNVAYRREVPFKVAVNGQWVEGRADFFVETNDGWKPVEMKGKANSKWTHAQEIYLPALQSGAKFETIGTSKFPDKVIGSGGGHVLNVHTVAKGKFNFQKEFPTTYIRRPKGDASKGEKITVVKDRDGNRLRETREPYQANGTKSSSASSKIDVTEPHVKMTEPKAHIKEPHVKVKGKGVLVGVIVGGITYFVTKDAYAAAQSVNPLAETTDATVEGKGSGQVAWGVVKDIWYLTPGGMVHATGQLAWDLNEAMMAASHFPVPEGWVAQKVAEGRNPFCAICHDPGGPLSEAARERERTRMLFDQFRLESVASNGSAPTVGAAGKATGIAWDKSEANQVQGSARPTASAPRIPATPHGQKPCPNCHKSMQSDDKAKDELVKKLKMEPFGGSKEQ